MVQRSRSTVAAAAACAIVMKLQIPTFPGSKANIC
jgi:hypothetical protein